MTCNACGEKPKNTAKDFTKAVIEINNPETLVLLRKVVIPASMGTEEQAPPAIGKYHNVILYYESNKHVYLYSSDGIPTLLEVDIPQELWDRVEALEEGLDDEEEARSTEDTRLQQEIDDLKNSPDVVDIVDTYADLQAYDTSHLGDKDIIRVLADETHDEASSYYRWDKETETWTYIGSVQTAINTIFYADLSETGNTRHIYKNSDMTGTVSVQDLLDANEDGQVILRMSSAQTPENFNDAYLQNTYVGVSDYQFLFLDNRNYYEYDGTATTDTSYYYSKSTIQLELTAGNNITIAGNTISATDTTYSNFTGTDGTSAGVAGLVPAPATTDAGKVLGADGTWTQNGPTVVQSRGNSTTDVMSQSATTSLIYSNIAPYTYGVGIRIGYSASNTTTALSEGVAIGAHSKASGGYGIALGTYAFAEGAGSIAIGGGSGTSDAPRVRANYTIAIGDHIDAELSNYSVCVGSHAANRNAKGCISLGAYSGSNLTAIGMMDISSSDTLYGYNSTNYRVLTGVHDPQTEHDAATKGYCDARIINGGSTPPTTSTVGTVGTLYSTVESGTGHLYICTSDAGGTYTWQTLI